MLKLSSQQYAGVVASLQRAASSGGSDKRRFARMEVQAPVKLGLLTENKITRCYVALSRDISPTGIGLCQAVNFGPKESFLILLPSAKQQMVVVCVPTFCRPLADGIYWVGAQFESEADPATSADFRGLAAAGLKAAG